MDLDSYFRGKKITVMGLGLLGRGMGDARFLAAHGAELIITDLKSEEQLKDSLTKLKEFTNITYVLGEHRLEDFVGRDFILKAAGIPLDSIYLKEAERNGIPVKMSASWFLELSNMPSIGVTGTRGKSTVTHMIAAILKEAQWPMLLGGNVRGVSTLSLLEEAEEGMIALLELDSWQLQGFGDTKLSPSVSVFTTFLSDHMNYYKGDMGAYLADKANIFLYQDPEDTLVLGAQCAERIQDVYADRIRAHTVIAGAHDFRSDWSLRIPGEHNRYNAALATEAARALDIDDAVIQKALEEFTGVPGRLEHVRSKDGIDFYNDTTATTPDATIAALEALAYDREGSTILIMGGADKGLSMGSLLESVRENARHVVLLAGSGTERISTELPGASIVGSLEEAVRDAYAHASPGDAIVLSPAFASFGMFKNEYDRGDQFNELIRNL